MAMTDSSATFEARVKELGLEASWEKFSGKGWTTYAAFAFSSSYVPGAPDEGPFMKVIEHLVGDTDGPLVPAVRRLFYEAFTLMSGQLKQLCERTDDSKAHQLTVAEREARRKRVMPATAGLDVEGVHDPAHCTQDLANQMLEDNCLQHIPWEKCPTRAE